MRKCAASACGVNAARTTQLEAMGGLGGTVLLLVSVSVRCYAMFLALVAFGIKARLLA